MQRKEAPRLNALDSRDALPPLGSNNKLASLIYIYKHCVGREIKQSFQAVCDVPGEENLKGMVRLEGDEL